MFGQLGARVNLSEAAVAYAGVRDPDLVDMEQDGDVTRPDQYANLLVLKCLHRNFDSSMLRLLAGRGDS